jgi:hypothetical protein
MYLIAGLAHLKCLFFKSIKTFSIMARNLNEFIQETVKNSGCVFSLFGGYSPKTGYVCSILKEQHAMPENHFSAYAVAQFIRQHAEKFAQPEYFLGSWINDGQIYLDVCFVTDNLYECLETAKVNGQLAIFDLDNMREITV